MTIEQKYGHPNKSPGKIRHSIRAMTTSEQRLLEFSDWLLVFEIN